MSNLALTASPYNEQESIINNNNNNNNSGSGIGEKREQRNNTNNKTIKKRPNIQEPFSTQNPNVKSMLNTIHEDNTGGNMADFNPPQQAQSTVPLKKTVIENNNHQFPSQIHHEIEQEDNIQNQNKNYQPDLPVTHEGFNNLPNTYSNDYYKQYVPYYNQMSQGTGNKDQLLEKLNYMIHLLEEQKDEKTGHIMEELILYSFLGVFMIFIVDSFARAGKYVR